MINELGIRGAVLAAALVFLAGCGGGGDADAPAAGELDRVAPTVTYVTPSNNASNAGTNARLTVTFSEAMSESSLAAAIGVIDEASGSAVALHGISFDRTNNIATLTPAAPLAPNRSYRAEISTSARDLVGNSLADAHAWRFATAGSADTTAPTVTSHAPGVGATDVPTGTAVAMSFSEPMDVTTVGAAFTLSGNGTEVAGALAYAGQAAVFTPGAPLEPRTRYVATLRRAAADLAGNALASDVVWAFTTGAGADTTPPIVLSVSPVSGATQVPRDAALVATFNEPIYPFVYGSIDGVLVEVAIDYATHTVTMVPTAPLRASGSYTGSAQVKDLAGNLMPAPYRWSFVTAP
jgi:hypothetical protein